MCYKSKLSDVLFWLTYLPTHVRFCPILANLPTQKSDIIYGRPLERTGKIKKICFLVKGDDEYPNMICVESGHVSSGVTLMPGTAFEASQILQVM